MEASRDHAPSTCAATPSALPPAEPFCGLCGEPCTEVDENEVAGFAICTTCLEDMIYAHDQH
jgi:formylmethanofuran dehydrogenase subunit E